MSLLQTTLGYGTRYGLSAFTMWGLPQFNSLHSVAQTFLQTLIKFKLGAIVRRFCILLSCSLLRERAVTYYI
jgi:hypothetical protein